MTDSENLRPFPVASGTLSGRQRYRERLSGGSSSASRSGYTPLETLGARPNAPLARRTGPALTAVAGGSPADPGHDP
jgi:hypothetical protein